MIACKMLLAIQIAAAWVFAVPAAACLQMPEQPGRLVVRSNPTGASVMIDHRLRGHTDVTFVVAPGRTYTVSVSGQGGNPNCPDKQVSVSSGQTVNLYCSGQNWSIN